MKTALCIPTLNAGQQAAELVTAIASQSVQPDIFLVIDSGSDDATVETFKQAGACIHGISRQEFNHGGTRQLAVERAAEAELIFFLTQDAIPAHRQSFENLLGCFDDPSVGVAFGRQLPRLEAGPIEAHARLFNYPSSSRRIALEDRATMGIKAVFLSNSFAAYRRADLQAVGGFPPHLIMGEDTYVAARMLFSARKVSYCAEATVYHSHDYNFVEEMRRYFDAGVLHAREPWIRENFGTAEGEGFRYMKSEVSYLLRRNPFLIPSAMLRNLLKLVGYRMGLLERKLPKTLKRQLSMLPTYWSGV